MKRVGLVGAGGIGVVRAKALVRARGFQLAAVADLNESNARKVADLSGALTFSDHRRMLDDVQLDALVISTPPHVHEAIAKDAADAGLHVLCEKPLSNSVASCRRMVEYAKSKGVILSTGFNHRYFAMAKLVRDTLDSGAIGELDHVRGFSGHVGMGELGGAAWMTDPEVMGGGTLMDNGIHLLDLVRFMLGEVKEVVGYGTERVWGIKGCEDNGFALLRSTSGKIATLHSTWTEWRGYRYWVAAYGTKGMAVGYYAPMLGMTIRMKETGGKAKRKFHLFPRLNLTEQLKGWRVNCENTFVEEFNDFERVIDGTGFGRIADGFDGFRAVEIAHAVAQSAKEGRSVTLVEPF